MDKQEYVSTWDGGHIRLLLQLTKLLLTLFDKVHWSQTRQMNLVRSVLSRLPTGWTVRGSNPGEARFSAPVQTGPPSLLYNGYRVFPGGKVLPGRNADPSPPSNAEVYNRVE